MSNSTGKGSYPFCTKSFYNITNSSTIYSIYQTRIDSDLDELVNDWFFGEVVIAPPEPPIISGTYMGTLLGVDFYRSLSIGAGPTTGTTTFNLTVNRTGNILYSGYGDPLVETCTGTIGHLYCTVSKNVSNPSVDLQSVVIFQFDTSSIPDNAYITGLEFYIRLHDIQPPGEPAVRALKYEIGNILAIGEDKYATPPNGDPEFNGNVYEAGLGDGAGGGNIMNLQLASYLYGDEDAVWVDLLSYCRDNLGALWGTWDVFEAYLRSLLDRNGVTDIRISDISTQGASQDTSWGTRFNYRSSDLCKLRTTYLLP